MELEKIHREAFISELQKARAEKEILETCLIKHQEKNDKNVVEFNHIELFLLNNKIQLIEQSLIDNEIDY